MEENNIDDNIGVITGSSGYYSYPQRITSKATASYKAQFSNNKLGICHITPYSLLRVSKGHTFPKPEVQYTISLQSDYDQVMPFYTDFLIIRGV